MKKKKQSFTQGVIILLVAQVLIKIIGLIYKLYLTNKEEFGDAGNAIYSSGFQIYAILLTLSSVGVPNAVSNLISEKISIGDEKNAKRIFKVAFAMFAVIGFICSILLFVGANYIAEKILLIPESNLTLQVLAPSVFFVALMAVIRGYFNAIGDMKPMATSQMIEQITKTALTIGIVEYICAYINAEHKTAIMAAGANLSTSIATIISYLYLYNHYKRYKTIKITNKKFSVERIDKVAKNILLVAIPITVGVLLNGLNKTIDSVTIVRGLKTFMSAEEAKLQYGILSGKIDMLVNLPMSFNMALVVSLIPKIAAAHSQNCLHKVERKIKFSLLTTAVISFPCTALMIIYANPILNLLFPNASSGSFVYQISAISIIFVMFNQIINGILQGIGKHFIPVISVGIGVILKLIVNVLLVPINSKKFIFGGLSGAALGTVICNIVTLFINVFALKRIIKFDVHEYKFLIKPVICTIIVSLISYFTYKIINENLIFNAKLGTIITIVVSVFIYLLFILLFKSSPIQKESIEIGKN